MRERFGNILKDQSKALAQRMADSVTNAAARRFDGYVTRKADEVDPEDEDDWQPSDDLLDRIDKSGFRLPVCFSLLGDQDQNLRLGTAAWRICANLPGQEGFQEDDEPDVLAVDSHDGWVFVGTITEWETFCQKQDRGHEWQILGVHSMQEDTVEYDFNELFDLPCDESCLEDLLDHCSKPKGAKAALDKAQEQHDGFHWNEGDNERTLLVVEIPGVQGPLFQMGTVKELQLDDGKVVYDFGDDWPGLYGLKDNVCVIAGKGVSEFLKRHPARGRQATVPGISGKVVCIGSGSNVVYKSSKGGELSLYTHKLGEDAPKAPDAFASGRDAIVIFGGDMVIEDRGIVH